MAYEGYLCYAGTEVINNARAAAYSQGLVNIHCNGGPWLPASLGDEPYTNPAADEAPWWDPAVPESRYFLGVAGLSVTGASDGTASSDWTDLVMDGAVPGPVRNGARELLFRVVLVGVGDAALSYGLAWLADTLRGDTCGHDSHITMYAAAPMPEPVIAGGGCDMDAAEARARWARSDWAAEPAERGDQLERTLYRCQVLDSVSVTSRARIGSAVVAEATFTLKAGNPWWWRRPVVVASTDTIEQQSPDYWSGYAEDYDADAVWRECQTLRESRDCLTDPLDTLPGCEPVAPPPHAAPPVDPCYPGGHYDGAIRTMIRVPPGLLPRWLDKVPVVTLSTGSRPLRRLTMRWWANPLNAPAGPDRDPCLVCSQWSVAYLPEQSTFTMDGRTKHMSVVCRGTTVQRPTLYGPDGRPMGWPVLECSSAMVLELIIDSRWPAAPDLELSVALAAREDAC